MGFFGQPLINKLILMFLLSLSILLLVFKNSIFLFQFFGWVLYKISEFLESVKIATCRKNWTENDYLKTNLNLKII